MSIDVSPFRVREGRRVDLKKRQNLLYADDRYALLLILQAMDAAGKDGVIKHVMSGVNPQGRQVFSFKHPSTEELDHDFLWRTTRCLPKRGRIGIFNRPCYEEVLIVRVHPETFVATHVLEAALFRASFEPLRLEPDLVRRPASHDVERLLVGACEREVLRRS